MSHGDWEIELVAAICALIIVAGFALLIAYLAWG